MRITDFTTCVTPSLFAVPGLPALSIYIGHAKVVDTYWYLTGIPELMAIAAERFYRYAEGVTP